MENSIYKIAFVEEMLFDLCVNRSLSLVPNTPISELDREWFRVSIRGAVATVRETIDFLIAEEEGVDYAAEPLCFSLNKRHRLHNITLPIRIENALIALICDKWIAEHNLKEMNYSDEALEQLRGSALKDDMGYKRVYNI